MRIFLFFITLQMVDCFLKKPATPTHLQVLYHSKMIVQTIENSLKKEILDINTLSDKFATFEVDEVDIPYIAYIAYLLKKESELEEKKKLKINKQIEQAYRGNDKHFLRMMSLMFYLIFIRHIENAT